MRNFLILIPVYECTYNELDRCLYSIQCQAGLSSRLFNTRVVICDDGSDIYLDSIKMIIRKYASILDITYTHNDVRTGRGAVRNELLEHVDSIGDDDWILFIDGDDYISDSYLYRLSELDNKYIAAITKLVTFSDTNQLTTWDYLTPYTKDLFIDYLYAETVGCINFTKRAVGELRFNENLTESEDIDFYMKLMNTLTYDNTYLYSIKDDACYYYYESLHSNKPYSIVGLEVTLGTISELEIDYTNENLVKALVRCIRSELYNYIKATGRASIAFELLHEILFENKLYDKLYVTEYEDHVNFDINKLMDQYKYLWRL